MAGNKTEKPTRQRLKRARDKGQFPAAKEFVSAAQFAIFAAILTWQLPAWWEGSKAGMAAALRNAFRSDIDAAAWIAMSRSMLVGAFIPALPAAAVLLGATLLLQLGSTNMGFSLSKLAPSFARFNPMGKLKEIPRNNVPAAGQALLVLGVVGYTIYTIGQDQLALLMVLPQASIYTGIETVSSSARDVLWRTTMVLFVIGAVELIRHRRMYNKDLAMTKQEVREEHKEQEGDPHIKGQIRRLRRNLLRQQMMKEVPTATAVIVNPTHYAVAIRYEPSTMACPKVIAKGRNLIAARIRELAGEHSIPIVENPPLARALYKAVDPGREIPAEFFRAVAEVLAYVYKVTGNRPSAG